MVPLVCSQFLEWNGYQLGSDYIMKNKKICHDYDYNNVIFPFFALPHPWTKLFRGKITFQLKDMPLSPSYFISLFLSLNI